MFGSMMDPPHLGHLAVVDAVHRACELDRIVVVPAGRPPHRDAPYVSARARLTMAVRAFADVEHVVVSDTEVDRGEHGDIGYMVDTLEELGDLPSLLGYDDLQVSLSLIIGADQAATLPSWHRFDRIAQLARLIVVQRPDQLGHEAEASTIATMRNAAKGLRVELVEMPSVPISSTLVRQVAAAGDRVRLATLVPDAILDDVLQLYADRA